MGSILRCVFMNHRPTVSPKTRMMKQEDKAKVLDITTIVTGTKVDTALSDYDNFFTYVVNEEVFEPNFDENRWHECAPGIHFFMTKKEALEYYKNSYYNFNW